MPLNVEHCGFKDQVYIKSNDKAKEYMLIKYLIKNEFQVISGMYNNDDGAIIFTVPNRDRRRVNKCGNKPHYVLCSVGKLNLVLYSFDYNGGVPTLLQN